MKIVKSAAVIIFSLFLIAGCDGSSSSDSSDQDGGTAVATGTLSVSLSDATTDDYQAIYITIQEVSVHRAEDEEAEGEGEGEEEDGETENGSEDEGWITVATPNETYNLLNLVNGVTEVLGITDLEAGHYTQMRLLLADTPDSGTNLLGDPHPYGNYVIDSSNTSEELTVPSGQQTGIKIVQGFDIAEDQTLSLILDFDAAKSIVQAGSSGKLILKPTIKVYDEGDIATVSGTVTDGVNAVGGVYVSVQTYDPAADIVGQVVVEGGTVTEDNGAYALRLDPGTYSVVAYRDGYEPVCASIVAVAGAAYTQDFTIIPAALVGDISGSVTVSGGGDDGSVTLSFRQTALCTGASGEGQIEVKSINVADGGTYTETLPEGTYTVVASTEGGDSQSQDIPTGSTVDWVF